MTAYNKFGIDISIKTDKTLCFTDLNSHMVSRSCKKNVLCGRSFACADDLISQQWSNMNV